MEKLKGRDLIAARCVKFFHDGDFINLGLGVPLLCLNYIPDNLHIWLASEMGIIGTGPAPARDQVDSDLVDPAGMPTSIIKGGSIVRHDTSFGIIRGHHIDMTVLGTLQVDQKGNIANWKIPGKMVPGMGGAMDLCAGINRVIVASDHCTGNKSKIVKTCTLPLTGKACVTDIVTERCYIQVTKDGLVLKEVAEGYTVADIIACTEADLIIPDEVGVMTA